MRYYFIAGERSGDLHAGNLAKAIRTLDPAAEMRGFGGEYLESAGVIIDVHYRELAVMGFWEVITNLNRIRQYLDRCKANILAYHPDVIVLVDFGGFNKRIAQWARANQIRVYYYISPKVWAWNEKRALKLKASVDRMFVILPFEKEFYKKFDWEVDYVGNPVLDAVKVHQKDPAFRTNHNLPVRPLIALLPGSRKQEVQNGLDLVISVATEFPAYIFAVAGVNSLDPGVYEKVKGRENIFLVFEDTYNLLLNSEAAIVTSGTATLETALLKVPQVVVYKTSFFSYEIARRLIRVPFISLVNLISGREVVKELIQGEFTRENVCKELQAILAGGKREQILSGYEEIYRKLDTGSASVNAATLMVRDLQETKNISKR